MEANSSRSSTNLLSEGSVGGQLIRFSLPVLLANLIQTAYSSVNIMFLGRFSTPAALAGVGNASSLIYTATSFFIGLMTGGTILLGQYFGARKDEDSARVTGNIAVLLLASSVVVTLLLFLFGRQFLRIIDIPPEAVPEAWRYMRICAWGLVFTMGYTAVSSVLRALGNSRAPLVFVAVSFAVHVALDILFIQALHMNAAGAAYATVIAQAVSFILALLYLYKTKLPYPLFIRHLRPDPGVIKRIVRLGLPISLQTLLNMLSFIVVAAIINGMGVSASAANGVVNNIINFYMVIPFAIGAALSAVSAQNIGAGKPERAARSTKLGVLISLVFAVPATVFANLYPEAIVAFFARDAEVIRDSALFLTSFSWDCVLVGFVFCINGFLNGCGITTFVALHETAAAFLVRIPLSWALSLLPGATLFHIGIGTPAATAFSLLLCAIYYKVKLDRGRLLTLKMREVG